jgi:uroporphyrinogen-III synthase
VKIKKILVSQPKPASEKSPYYDIEKKYGVNIEFRPFIKVDPVSSKEFRAQKVNILDHSAIIFTAKTGIDHFFRLCKELRIEIPDSLKYFCISEKVSLYLQHYVQYRKRKVFFGTTGKFPSLLEHIDKHKEEKFLLVCTDVHNEENTRLLDEHGVNFKMGVMYRTVSNDFRPDEKFDYDLLVFFAPNGVDSLQKNFPNFEQGDISIACFGANTAKAVSEAGLRLDCEAPTQQYSSMSAAIEGYLKEVLKKEKVAKKK